MTRFASDNTCQTVNTLKGYVAALERSPMGNSTFMVAYIVLQSQNCKTEEEGSGEQGRVEEANEKNLCQVCVPVIELSSNYELSTELRYRLVEQTYLSPRL